MLRRGVLVLILAQFILLVVLAVLIGGYALTSAAHDAAGATALWWLAMGCLMLLVTNVVLLVGALGVAALVDSEPSPPPADP